MLSGADHILNSYGRLGTRSTLARFPLSKVEENVMLSKVKTLCAGILLANDRGDSMVGIQRMKE